MTYKKLKTVTHEIELKNGEILEIRLPANYQIIFDNVRMGKAPYATTRLYENFVTQYTRLDRYGKEKFQDFANSGKFKTEDVCDLLCILNIMHNYFCGTNIEDFEELGMVYASMNRLEYKGDTTKVDMRFKYEELGRAVCEAHDGFFADGKFYGLILNK